MLHSAVEAILNGDLEKDTDIIGYEEDGCVLTRDLYDEMIVPAMQAFDTLFDDRFEFYTEQRVNFPGIPDSFGTSDVLGTVDDYGVILDWKFGRGVAVTAENNSQILFCAAAARHTRPKLFNSVKTFKGIIVQPAMGGPSIWDFTHDDIDKFQVDLSNAWADAQVAEAKLTEGKWCTFCAAQAICPAKRDKIKRVQQLPTNTHHEPSDLSEMMSLAVTMKEWAKSVETMTHAELERGVQVPGWKLVPKRATRHWTDIDSAEKFLKSTKMKAAEIHPRKLVSVAQAEKWLKHNSTERALKSRMTKLAALQDSTSSGTTLAPSDDKREAVSVDPGAAIRKIGNLK